MKVACASMLSFRGASAPDDQKRWLIPGKKPFELVLAHAVTLPSKQASFA
jgi:hypothetical protein